MSKYLVGFVILLALLYSPLKQYITIMGAFRSVPEPPVGSSNCRLVTYPGLAACEDVSFYKDGLFIASCHPTRFQFVAQSNNTNGNLFLLDLKTPGAPEVHPFKVENQNEENSFHPHGMSLYEKDDSLYIFVINHANLSYNVIDIFLVSDLSTYTLKHIRRIADPLIRTPNDLVAVGIDKFYVTNDHYFPATSQLLQIAEMFSTAPISDAVYCDGDKCQVAAKNLASPNGINTNHDQSVVYLAETLTGKVRFYDRNPETGDLYETGAIELDNLLDNIEVDRVTGELFVAAHPLGLKTFAHLANPESRSPVRIIKVSNNTKADLFLGVKYMSQDVIFNDGVQFGGVATGTYDPHGKHLVLGAIFDQGLLVCNN
eukprot:TRINITY_DN7401_c0_g1_i1.p1 TRINITY_DN7401_c0_g1~~TRINITY_DN7401_c0_g1_i1.p1  ORF type:complete len:372 (+),score=69.84 TRINITY_DN7401_c0_g1_i1:85-1200(+)